MARQLISEKILIVAHPDDEVLWFNPKSFDKIYIVFTHRKDKPRMGKAREYVVTRYHPLKDKIKLLGFTEPVTKADEEEVSLQLHKILRKLSRKQVVYTHNSWGEYGHKHHVLVHKIVSKAFNPENIYYPTYPHKPPYNAIYEQIDLYLYRLTKYLYKKQKVWTWDDDFEPEPTLSFFRQ